MHTIRDFLIWYNNLDVQPFLEAIEKMFQFYKDKNIDMFKDGISIPGLTLKYMFSTLPDDTFFTLYGRQQEELYKLVKNGIVGGPSLVFSRYHEKDVTKIRNGKYVCAGVVGFDANALYLHALMQPQPTGWAIWRKYDDGFRPKCTHRFGRMSLQWLEWERLQSGIHIRHKFNSTEKRIGARKLPVDGFAATTNTCYQFHGCFWHGHSCRLTEGRDFNSIRQLPMAKLFEDTQENKKYILSLGYNYKEMWECEWYDLKKRKQRSM